MSQREEEPAARRVVREYSTSSDDELLNQARQNGTRGSNRLNALNLACQRLTINRMMLDFDLEPEGKEYFQIQVDRWDKALIGVSEDNWGLMRRALQEEAQLILENASFRPTIADPGFESAVEDAAQETEDEANLFLRVASFL